MASNVDIKTICDEFSSILNGTGKVENGVCSVSLKRTFPIQMQGKDASSVLGVSVDFQSLDNQGNALNIVEAPLLQEEVPNYTYAALAQGIIVSAVHNHWLFTEPQQLMYVHLQSVEPPLQFAQKMAYVFSQLSSPPVAK